MKFYKKIDNYVTNSTTKINWWKSKLLKRIDERVTLLLRYQKQEYFWSQKWHKTREVTLFQERYRITKQQHVIVSMAFTCVTLLTSDL